MKFKRAPLIGLLWLFVAQAWAEPVSVVRFYTDVSASSPAIAISKLESDWATVGSGRYFQAKARAGVEYSFANAWSVGIERRLDYILHFSESTAQFYKKLESNDLPEGSYPLELDVNVVMASGVFACYFIPLSISSDISITSHFLRPDQVQQGRLTGVGNVLADGDYNYHYDLDYYYDENKLITTKLNTVSGWGHSFDIQYYSKFDSNWAYSVAVNDLFYSYYWQFINTDEGCLSHGDSGGACRVFQGQSSHTQTLPATFEVSVSKSWLSGVKASLLARQWSRQQSQELAGEWKGYGLGFDLVSKVYSFAFESDMVRLNLASDQLQLSKSKHWQVSVDVNWPFL